MWCELNAEQEALADLLGSRCLSIYGSLESISKERRYQSWADNEVRILLTKASIFGWGLNMQHCCRQAFVGVSDSFEKTYQALRRCWRFGQKREVHAHFFASELEGEVVKNLRRKERDAEAMAEQLSIETREAVTLEVRGQVRNTNPYAPGIVRVPSWIQSEQECA